MDLSLNIADTFTWNTPDGIYTEQIVQNVFIDNSRKTVEFNRGFGAFIEGVGSTIAFFIHDGSVYSSNTFFLCSHKDGVLYYENPDFDTCFIPFHLTGVDSNLSTENVKIYPNPAKNILSVEFDTERKEKNIISLFDISGRIIFSKLTDFNKISINVSEFEKGIYFIKINNQKTQKLVINN